MVPGCGAAGAGAASQALSIAFQPAVPRSGLFPSNLGMHGARWSEHGHRGVLWQPDTQKPGAWMQAGSSLLHQQPWLSRPPPFCHLPDKELILSYRWRGPLFLFFCHGKPSQLSSGFCRILKIAKPTCIALLRCVQPAGL